MNNHLLVRKIETYSKERSNYIRKEMLKNKIFEQDRINQLRLDARNRDEIRRQKRYEIELKDYEEKLEKQRLLRVVLLTYMYIVVRLLSFNVFVFHFIDIHFPPYMYVSSEFFYFHT